jgi:predicted enzyme related to lactoylglutathione lyase
MPERDGYAPGTPSWVDLTTPDVDGAKAFYGDLFGWTAEDAGDPEQLGETGGYAMFLSGGRRVAGVGPIMGEAQPTYRTTYFATDDADALAARVTAAGGNALVEPMDVMDAGRMAVFVHPAAGMFGAWQAGSHTGAQLVNEPVSLAWNSLMTRDVDAASAFLATAFPGLRAESQDFGGEPYTILMLGERGVGGVTPMPPGVPDEAPAFWNVSFSVADADATAARAAELGGRVLMDPVDMPGVGRIAGLADPYGASFSVGQLGGG